MSTQKPPNPPRAKRVRLVVDVDAADADTIAKILDAAAIRPPRSEVLRTALRRGLAQLSAVEVIL